MGQAKKRGSFEERQKEAIAKNKIANDARLEYLKNRPKLTASVSTIAAMAMIAGLSAQRLTRIYTPK